ncbi:MAG: hypothetical protein N3A61_01385 [Ignavibacteria bacterium]|nr:hypothetical protein [Ignavibacteria bacterium]
MNNYIISIKTINNSHFINITSLTGREIYSRNFSRPELYLIDLDEDSFEEAIIVDSTYVETRPNFTLFIYRFDPQFSFCDSLQLGQYELDIIKPDSASPFLIKTYDLKYDKIFGSSFPVLPLKFYYLLDTALVLDDEFSYDEYEAEVDRLFDLLSDMKRGLDCSETSSVNDIKKLVAVLYANIKTMNYRIDLSIFVKNNYPCDDIDELIKSINEIQKME